jgi:hypothetical protein
MNIYRQNQILKNNLVPLNILKNFNKYKKTLFYPKQFTYGWCFAQFVFNKFLLSIQYKKILKDSMYFNVIINDWIENGLDKNYAEVIDLGSFYSSSIYLQSLDVQNGLSNQLNDPSIRLDDEQDA